MSQLSRQLDFKKNIILLLLQNIGVIFLNCLLAIQSVRAHTAWYEQRYVRQDSSGRPAHSQVVRIMNINLYLLKMDLNYSKELI